jgi:uncharacterized membrane protein YkgB
MKRVKIMLLSFALLAIVGGALAFKANYGTLSFCYTTTTAPSSFCITTPTAAVHAASPNEQGRVTIYSTPSVFIEGIGWQCTLDENLNALTCPATTTVKTN